MTDGGTGTYFLSPRLVWPPWCSGPTPRTGKLTRTTDFAPLAPLRKWEGLILKASQSTLIPSDGGLGLHAGSPPPFPATCGQAGHRREPGACCTESQFMNCGYFVCLLESTKICHLCG